MRIATTSDQPLVSVLMPAYQHARFVEQAIRSVWNQSYRPLELLVCDDCSSDSTYEVASDLLKESPISMKVFRNPVNRGICGTLNSLIEQSTGEWIALLPSDDFYGELFIARNMEAVRELGSKLVCLHSDAHRVDERGDSIDYQSAFTKPPVTGEAFWQVAEGTGRIVPPTVFTSRLVYERAGGFDDTLRAEDFDLHLRVSRFAKYHYIDEKHLFKRESPTSLGHQTHWTRDIFVALSKHRDVDRDRIDALIDGKYLRHARRCGLLADPALARELAAEYRGRTGRTTLLIWLQFAVGYMVRIVRNIIGPGTASRVITRVRRTPNAGK